MSEQEIGKEMEEIEVQELDDGDLEDVAGGRGVFEEDPNNNCGCNNDNCGCGAE